LLERGGLGRAGLLDDSQAILLLRPNREHHRGLGRDPLERFDRGFHIIQVNVSAANHGCVLHPTGDEKLAPVDHAEVTGA
jgi:hypothetical protein